MVISWVQQETTGKIHKHYVSSNVGNIVVVLTKDICIYKLSSCCTFTKDHSLLSNNTKNSDYLLAMAVLTKQVLAETHSDMAGPETSRPILPSHSMLFQRYWTDH